MRMQKIGASGTSWCQIGFPPRKGAESHGFHLVFHINIQLYQPVNPQLSFMLQCYFLAGCVLIGKAEPVGRDHQRTTGTQRPLGTGAAGNGRLALAGGYRPNAKVHGMVVRIGAAPFRSIRTRVRAVHGRRSPRDAANVGGQRPQGRRRIGRHVPRSRLFNPGRQVFGGDLRIKTGMHRPRLRT